MHLRLLFIALTLAAWFAMPGISYSAATITIINADSSGEGFNDTTAFTAQGGNSATTLGQARLNAFQYAANLLAMYIESSIEIRVRAQIKPLGGTNPITLGSAAPYVVTRDFTNAPQANTWYTIAVAEKLAGIELNNGVDISATFNSDVDRSDTMAGRQFYYGFDKNSGSDTDFVTVVLHELIHGLGFLSLVDLNSGAKYFSYNDAYMRHLEYHGSTPADYPSMSDAERITASKATGNLHWTGANVLANDGALTDGNANGHVEMYAPSPIEESSSVSHFSPDVTPNEIMEPFYTSPLHRPGLAAHLLADVGWSPINSTSGSADLQLSISDSADPVDADNNVSYTITTTNNGPDSAAQTTLTIFLPGDSTYVSAGTSQGSCRRVDNIVTCVIGTIASAAAPTATVILTPKQGGNINLAAVVSSITNDTDTTNNLSSETTSINGITDLAVSLSKVPEPVTAGKDITYIANITNNGPSNARNVVATVNLPADSSFISAPASQGSCSRSDLTLTCTLGTINTDNSALITISVTTVTAGNLSLSASVSTSDQENNTANNSAITYSTVQAPALSAGSSSCFIATATYGSVMAKDVTTLRKFRDHYLLTNPAGQWFVKNYYRYSPPIANELAKSPVLKAVMKGLLFPLVAVSRLLTDEQI